MHTQTEYIRAERQTILYSSSSSSSRHVNIFFVLHKCEIDWPVDRKNRKRREKGINLHSSSSNSSTSMTFFF
jgi:hypothetical protein